MYSSETCVYVRMHMCVHVQYVYMYVCMYVYMLMCMWICMHMYMNAYACACMHASTDTTTTKINRWVGAVVTRTCDIKKKAGR